MLESVTRQYWDTKTVNNQVTYLAYLFEQTDEPLPQRRPGYDLCNNMPIELFQKLKKEIPNEVRVDPYLCTHITKLIIKSAV